MIGHTENRADLVQIITSPLGFFALSLLTVEGFLTIALVFSNLNPESKLWGMIIGASLFLVVVVGVFLLVWFKPTSLTFGEKSHLQLLEFQKAWGTSDKPERKAEIESFNALVKPIIEHLTTTR